MKDSTTPQTDDCDNCNDNKEFDQGKTPAIICIHNSTFPFKFPNIKCKKEIGV